MTGHSVLSEPFVLGELILKNRITMAPLFLGYANPDGTAGSLIVDHYREMAASGAAMIVVENAAVHESGMGSPFVLRADDDRFIPGLSKIARAIRDEGARAFLQINHAGRYSFTPDRLAPSPFDTGGVIPREMNRREIALMTGAYAEAAGRAREAGFDGVEIHGGTGYLLVQFLSSRTNHRTDEYGGPLENRMRFPLEIVRAVLDEVGPGYPVGYRFLADELVPGGITLDETALLAVRLEKTWLAYLSVMAGTYDSFFQPDYLEKERQEGYMVAYAGEIKKAAPDIPIITAGRIQSPETASNAIREGRADLVGLARVLLADPLWPKKAEGIVSEPITPCEPTCSLCMKRIMAGKPAYCSQWSRERRKAFLEKVGESPGNEHDKRE